MSGRRPPLGRRRPHRPANAACASPSTAGATRALPATRWPRRCSPTASTWSAAASSITGRAASSPPASRSPTRSCSSSVARAPSPTSRATQIELYDGLVAASQNCWPCVDFDLGASTICFSRFSRRASTTRPSCGRQRFWMRLRAFHPPRRGPGPRAAERRIPTATTSTVCPLRRAGRRRRARRARRRARRRAQRRAGHPGRRAGRARRLAARRGADGDHRRRRAAATGCARPWPSLRRCRRSACCRAPPPSAITTTTYLTLIERVADHLARPAAGQRRASASGRCARAGSCWRPAPSSGRWSSPTTTGRAVMLASAASRPMSPLRGAARPASAVVMHQQRRRLSRRRSRWRRPASRSSPWSICAARRGRRGAQTRAPGRHRRRDRWPVMRSSRPRAGSRRQRGHASWRLDAAGTQVDGSGRAGSPAI